MESYHRQLLDPASYPEPTTAVEFRETHISRVYLTDRHAYKLKKPLDLGFLDFSTLERRRHFCREEVRLNRRFTHDVYLGVAALRRRDGRVGFCGRGEIVDFAVRMRRLPEERMLDRLIDAGAPELAQAVPRLGDAVHALMERSEPCPAGEERNAETVRRNCAENFEQTRASIGTVLSAEAHTLMQDATGRDLADLGELMQEREVAGFVRDGHGDLHAANICMTEPVCIYDCIEFNRRFRVGDTMAELAFLLMDLEFRGRRDLAADLAGHCLARSGDFAGLLLLPFYKGYRAWVRGKVAALLAGEADSDPATRDRAATQAQRYFNLALGYRLAPTLLLTAGLMGVGKTTLARALAAATGAAHLRSDTLRKELAGRPSWLASRDAFGAGIYSREVTARTYAALRELAAGHLAEGRSVIVDASFARGVDRTGFLELADRVGCPGWLLHLSCPDRLALERLDRRTDDASDGRRELFGQQQATFDPVAADRRVILVDTSQAVDYNVQSILCRVLGGRER